MSRPLESFEFLSRGWDVRILEGLSLRSVFVMLLVDLFILGALAALSIYGIFHLHRFEWTTAMIGFVLLVPVLRYIPLVYRRLGR
jgi:hypothetical protein